MESRFRFDGCLSTSTLLAFRAKLFSHLFWNEFAWQFLVEFCGAPGGERRGRNDSTLGCTDFCQEVEEARCLGRERRWRKVAVGLRVE